MSDFNRPLKSSDDFFLAQRRGSIRPHCSASGCSGLPHEVRVRTRTRVHFSGVRNLVHSVHSRILLPNTSSVFLPSIHPTTVAPMIQGEGNGLVAFTCRLILYTTHTNAQSSLTSDHSAQQSSHTKMWVVILVQKLRSAPSTNTPPSGSCHLVPFGCLTFLPLDRASPPDRSKRSHHSWASSAYAY